MSGGAGLSPAAPPVPLTGLVGREREIAELGRMLTEHRVVTVTGSGGGGKTRLAIAVATMESARPPDGVCWVELAPLGDPALPAQAVAAALGV
jgi:predicted ATPase